MKVRLAQDSDRFAWDDYVQRHPEGLAYHRFPWRMAIEKVYGFKGTYFLAEDGSGLRGVLPLINFRRPLLGASLISLPYCDVGGPLSDTPEIARSLLDSAFSYSAQRGYEILDIRFGSISNSVEQVGENLKARMLLALPETSEALMAGFKSKLRSQIKKPIRDGLTAQIGGTELVDEFYQIFSVNMHELGSPVHAKQWFQTVVESFAGNARVGVVYTADGRPAASGIILSNRRIVSIPWASSIRSLNRLNPNVLLYWTFLSYAADNSYDYFDFGRSAYDVGTYRFKEQWGAKPAPLLWVKYNTRGERILGGTSNSTKLRTKLETCWRHLPVSLCNLIGPQVRRYISL